MDYKAKLGLRLSANIEANPGLRVGRGLTEHYKFECFGSDGKLKWVEEFDNLVVNEGLNDSIDKHFKGSNYSAAWYVGLMGATPTVAAGDTMASHAGWTEFVDYSQATRPALTLGAVSGGAADNSASKASFSINDTGTVGGGFVATNSTKSGSTGTLYGGGAFTEGNRAVVSGDTLNVTVTVSAVAV